MVWRRWKWKRGLAWGGSLVAILCLPTFGAKKSQQDVQSENAKCFECHTKTETHFTFASGEKLSQRIDDSAYYRQDVHAREIPCTGCHENYREEWHPQIEVFKSIKEYRLERYPLCKSCHEKQYEQHADSIHATLIKEGNDKPPVCSDCHTVHTMHSLKKLRQESVSVCKKCHEPIFERYTTSVHGKATAKGDMESAICSDCHGAHDIQRGKQEHASTARDRISRTCGECHKEIELEVQRSVHRKRGGGKQASKIPVCIDCHGEHEIHEVAANAKGRHVFLEGMRKYCGDCHTKFQKEYADSLHGIAAKKDDPLAPTCWGCHGKHEIFHSSNPNATTAVPNVPALCGKCHHEGSEVELTHEIHQDHVFENYSQSIHGEGIFKRGLVVTAVCSSCHGAHQILPHTDPRSSISAGQISKTCTKCHAQIKQVHRKIIRGELWTTEPSKIPACVDCHSPHKIRKVFYTKGMADEDCMVCHSKDDLSSEKGRTSEQLHVEISELGDSRHSGVACIQCHTGAMPSHVRACETIAERVDCSICHAKVVDEYQGSVHGTLVASGNADAPHCEDCHGTHGIKGKQDLDSPTYSRNVPALCGDCHSVGEKAAFRQKGEGREAVEHYTESIHGKGLLESGLTVSATCASCHTAHGELPAKDPRSTVHPTNIAKTCGQCHEGVFELFRSSIHSPDVSESDEELPGCNDCHSAHTIERTDLTAFRLTIMDQCGECHEDVAETYFATYHGKVAKLGYTKIAKCHDCHTAHEVLPASNPASKLHSSNIVQTCATCHPSANANFTGYLTHANHHDYKKYPLLFLTFWGMTLLLVGTFTVAGLHTLMWLPQSLRLRKEFKKAHAEDGKKYVRRFSSFNSKLHLMVIVSFFALALTGMMLKFSEAGWAHFLSRLFGGFETAGLIHRAAAIVTFLYFALHIWDVLARKRKEMGGVKNLLFGPNTMLPTKRDAQEVVASFKWFLGKGPRPQYGRWTYWEKFDYFAVFWGVAIIGSTGLILWFPEFFTLFVPGWVLNVATIIHSDEALLAVGFIFTIHFFNTHFRPEKFPMDPVIFTGSVSLEELKLERPREYEELVASGELESKMTDPPSEHSLHLWRIFGFTALATGFALVLSIIFAAVFS